MNKDSENDAHHLQSGLHHFPLSKFSVHTLRTESKYLENNPLGDSPIRFHPVLVPRSPAPAEGWPVVFVLAGFTGNGPNYFNVKTFDSNLPQVLDRCAAKGDAPIALYVFVDAMTQWGGSQFINSEGTGRYEDFVADEIPNAVLETFPVDPRPSKWCVVGGSSGGYGALHLSSQRPQRFGIAGAIAPDSFFEASLLPELWSAAPALAKIGGVRGAQVEKDSGRLFKRKEAHTLLNTVAMGLCYASDGRGDVDFPIDLHSGQLIPEIWGRWRLHDPIEFLKTRDTKQIKSIYLDVGTRDQYHLQFGTRQIFNVLKNAGANVSYREFEGNHFDIGDRRPELWKWLAQALL